MAIGIAVQRAPVTAAALFVAAHCHDSVCEVERLLYAITVVDVNVNVQHPAKQQAQVGRTAHF
jgi:hypothetical protein